MGIAQLRKAQNNTPTQLADALAVARQTMGRYEVARLRMPVALLPMLATLLLETAEKIVGKPSQTELCRGDIRHGDSAVGFLNAL